MKTNQLIRGGKIRSKKYREAARDQPCTLNILGACTYDESTTVLCHLPGENKGTATKVCDMNGVDGCSGCHAVIDGPSSGWPGEEYQYRDYYLKRALHRTIVNRVMRGIVQISDVEAIQ